MSDYVKDVWDGIYTALIGMKITIRHLFAKNVTVQYPNVHPKERASTDKMPENARNRLYLHAERCNGCNSCARECPVDCITVETIKVSPDDPDDPKLLVPDEDGSIKEQSRKLWVSKYDLDFAKCCFCSLCTTVCPTEAIVMTPEFEYSTYDRNNLLYHFSVMTPEQIAEKEKLAAEYSKKQKEAKAKAAAAKKAAEAKKPTDGAVGKKSPEKVPSKNDEGSENDSE